MSIADLEAVVQRRLARANADIVHSLECVAAGNPLAAERNPARLRARLQQKAKLSREEAEAVAVSVEGVSKASEAARAEMLGGRGPEAIYGKTIDFVGISFLERGSSAARAVGRVAFRNGQAQGSGVMVSDRVFLTNHHVIPSIEQAGGLCIEFDYELDPADKPRGVSRFAFDPSKLFMTDSVDGLDFTLVAIGPRLAGSKALSDFGWCPITDAPDKHALGEVANIIQHPDGRYKEVVLRENRLVSRLDLVLHYVADTQPGSSGSPVFNNDWEVIALHHWGGPWRGTTDAQGRKVPTEVNEGIRISAIVRELRSMRPKLDERARRYLDEVLAKGEARQVPPAPQERPEPKGTSARVEADGSVTWTVPLEVSVRLPHLSAPGGRDASDAPPPPATEPSPASEAKVKPSTDYSDRGGYKPRFIEGFEVPMPRLSKEQKKVAAKNQQAEAGDDPFELKYHHFSVIMNGARKLAFFTACNIDGSKAKHVDRRKGTVAPLDPDDPHLESIAAASEAAEGGETWYGDDRLDEDQYAGSDVYSSPIQKVKGYPDPNSTGRKLRMFQRGHLVRRMDPAWGTDKQALLADADTFHWTNCSPQVGFFNMGQAKPKPGNGGGLLWRAMENYVLRNAVVEKKRICSFTGPVFAKNDKKFRGLQVPGRFWKIAVWAEGEELRSLAMLADQRPVISVWPEAMEGFTDEDEISKVEDFLSSIAEIEELTGLDMSAIREADVRGGGESVHVTRMEEIPVVSSPRAATRPVGRRKRPAR